MAEIELRGVGVEYPQITSPVHRSLFAGMGGKTRPRHFGRGAVRVAALKGVELKLNESERLGLVGRNGAGKSTLLRTLAGICPPTDGYVRVEGDILTVFEPMAAFNRERTGYENIEMAAMLMGLDRRQRNSIVEDVADFTELGDYLTMPLAAFSTGMALRLAFGVATAVRRDILLIDEAIGAGDATFQAKAFARVQALCDRGSILVLASHSYETLSLFCDRYALLQDGQITARGDLDEIWDRYLGTFIEGHARDRRAQA